MLDPQEPEARLERAMQDSVTLGAQLTTGRSSHH